jgi:hypothetical protein
VKNKVAPPTAAQALYPHLPSAAPSPKSLAAKPARERLLRDLRELRHAMEKATKLKVQRKENYK